MQPHGSWVQANHTQCAGLCSPEKTWKPIMWFACCRHFLPLGGVGHPRLAEHIGQEWVWGAECDAIPFAFRLGYIQTVLCWLPLLPLRPSTQSPTRSLGSIVK